jgi:hypothetical protein
MEGRVVNCAAKNIAARRPESEKETLRTSSRFIIEKSDIEVFEAVARSLSCLCWALCRLSKRFRSAATELGKHFHEAAFLHLQILASVFGILSPDV